MTGVSTRVAIVTGASRGNGAAVAERLAADGFAVVVNYSGNAKPAEELAHKIEAKGGRALTAKMNQLERLETPGDIVASVSFLARPDGGWINGQVLRANGVIV